MKLRLYICALYAALLALVIAISPASAGQMSLLGAGKASAGGGGGCVEATAFLARTSSLDATHQTAYTTLICGLVTDGSFAKFDGLWIISTQDLATARLNLVQNNYNLTGTGMTFVADRGATDAGGSAFFDTGFTPSTAGGQYILNDAHAMFWGNTNGGTGVDMGYGNGIGGYLQMGSNASNTNMAINIGSGALSPVSATPTGVGFFVGSRTTSTNRDGYWAAPNAGSVTSLGTANSGTTSALPGGSIAIGAVPGQNYSGRQISAASIGSSLTSGQVSSFYTRIQAFMTAVGN